MVHQAYSASGCNSKDAPIFSHRNDSCCGMLTMNPKSSVKCVIKSIGSYLDYARVGGFHRQDAHLNCLRSDV